MSTSRSLRVVIAVSLICALSAVAYGRRVSSGTEAGAETAGTAASGASSEKGDAESLDRIRKIVLPQGTTIVVNGRTLTGSVSFPQQRGGRTFLPLVSIARALGDTVFVDATARTVEIRRQNGVVADFNAQLGHVRENGSVILVVSNTADIVFPPNTDELMLPIEIVFSLLDASILFDEATQALRITRGPVQADTVRAGTRRSTWELFRADYEYNFNMYSTAYNQNLTLRTSGRIGDGRFDFVSNSSSGTGVGLDLLRNSTAMYERPNGQRFIGGDFGTGTDLLFMSTSLRGGWAQMPVGGTRVTAFGGRAVSGVLPLETLSPVLPTEIKPPTQPQPSPKLQYDTSVFGAYATFGSSGTSQFTPNPFLFSSGVMYFRGPNRSGEMFAGSARYASARGSFQGDIGAGQFSGVQREGTTVDGFGLAADLSGSLNVMDNLTLQGRYTRVDKNFLSPQAGLQTPISLLAGGFTWRPKEWLSTSLTGSSSSRPDLPGEGQRFISSTVSVTPKGAGPSVFLSHTQSSTSQVRGGAYTLLNVAKNFSRWNLFVNATRIKTVGPTFINSQVGADIRIDDSNRLQVSQSFGSRGSLSGTVNWQSSEFLINKLSLGAGFGYSRSESSPLTTSERVSATLRLPRQNTLQVTYGYDPSGQQLIVSLRGALLSKRKAEAAANAPVTEINSYGAFYGKVYQDVNMNGRFDPEVDHPQANVQVRVDGNLYAVTDRDGQFKVDNVRVGEHTVYLDLLSVRADLTILDSQLHTVELRPEGDSIVDFRLVRTGRITGSVWLDQNGNGKMEEGEQPLSEVRVVTGSGRDTLSDEQGGFVIGDLAPGQHVVLIDEKTLPENTTVGGAGVGASHAPAPAPRQEEAARARRLDVRMRSFAAGASGLLSVVPNPAGGYAQLTALGLPAPETLNPRATTYVVWAVAPGGRIVNLGEMKRDARGNGGLGFMTPVSLERYSIVMTAEASVKAASPLGTLVLSTRGGEVTALFAKKNDLRKAAPQVSVNISNPVAGSLQVTVKAGSETGDVNFAVIPKPPEIKRFPSTP